VLSVRTVESHVAAAYRKIGVGGRTAAPPPRRTCSGTASTETPYRDGGTTQRPEAGRWAGLAGRLQNGGGSGRGFVFLHGLTFDRQMWSPALDALPSQSPGLALELPGHGDSPPLARHNLEDVVAAVHEAVHAAGLEAPIVVGHSIGGLLATLYAARYPAGGRGQRRTAPELARAVRASGTLGRAAASWARVRRRVVDVPGQHAHGARSRRRPRSAAGGRAGSAGHGGELLGRRIARLTGVLRSIAASSSAVP
jgi:pimeloyl-ACP methyl ester carboxylesterase